MVVYWLVLGLSSGLEQYDSLLMLFFFYSPLFFFVILFLLLSSSNLSTSYKDNNTLIAHIVLLTLHPYFYLTFSCYHTEYEMDRNYKGRWNLLSLYGPSD